MREPHGLKCSTYCTVYSLQVRSKADSTEIIDGTNSLLISFPLVHHSGIIIIPFFFSKTYRDTQDLGALLVIVTPVKQLAVCEQQSEKRSLLERHVDVAINFLTKRFDVRLRNRVGAVGSVDSESRFAIFLARILWEKN
jgi:hypothetical protein